MTIRLGFALGALVFATLLPATASAGRQVAINGQWMTPQEISVLDQWHCGPVPDGSYWLDPQTGIWGYAGDPMPRGTIADGCYAQPQHYQQPQRRQSLSERGLLYSPGELLR